ncbi:MAG TPA: hypothetical protein VF767_00360 [Bryobacteraceae bacterium]
MQVGRVSRRTFVSSMAVSLATARAYARVPGANERLRIRVIGCGGMATHHTPPEVHALGSGQRADRPGLI